MQKPWNETQQGLKLRVMPRSLLQSGNVCLGSSYESNIISLEFGMSLSSIRINQILILETDQQFKIIYLLSQHLQINLD